MNFAAADYPHRCLRCGSAAYDSGFSVKCTSQVCPNLDPVLGGKTSSPILVQTQREDLKHLRLGSLSTMDPFSVACGRDVYEKAFPPPSFVSVLDTIKSMDHMDIIESINKSTMERMEQSFVKPVSPAVLDAFNKLTFGKSRIVLGQEPPAAPTFEDLYNSAWNAPKGGKSYANLTLSRAELEASDELPGGVLRHYVEDLYRHAVPHGAEIMKVSSRVDGSSLHIDVTMQLKHPMPHMPITFARPDHEISVVLEKARNPQPGTAVLIKGCSDPKMNGIYQVAPPWDGSAPGSDRPKLPDIDEDVAQIDDIFGPAAGVAFDDDDPDSFHPDPYGDDDEDQDDDVSLA